VVHLFAQDALNRFIVGALLDDWDFEAAGAANSDGG
jgi:hypothetical protein